MSNQLTTAIRTYLQTRQWINKVIICGITELYDVHTDQYYYIKSEKIILRSRNRDCKR